MAKVTRKGKVKHIVLDTTDRYAQDMAKANLTSEGLIDFLFDNGRYDGFDEFDVTYEQDHEGNYVRPKGHDMGHGCYWVGGSPLCKGTKNIQRALKAGWKDASRG